MPANPYLYGTPVEAALFAGREQELRALQSIVRNHLNAVVVAPRRYGKTSLLLRAEERLARSHAAVVHVNVFGAKDVTSFASRLVTATYRLPGGRWHAARNGVAEFLKALRITPEVSLDATGTPTFSVLGRHEHREAEEAIATSYGLLDELAARRPVALVLDEFQAVPNLSEHLPFLLKALADEHRRVSLLLAGSLAHVMARLVLDEQAPLYGMAQRLSLGPIPQEEMVEFLTARAAAGAVEMSEQAARLVVELAWPTPNDIQRLAYHAFEVASGPKIDVAEVEAGFDLAVRLEDLSFAEILARVSPGQRGVLQQLAVEPTAAPYGRGFVEATGLANASSVRKAVESLRAASLVADIGGELRLADPFLARWLARL